MLAVSAVGIDPADPLSGLAVGERPDPTPSRGLDHGRRTRCRAQPSRPVEPEGRRPARGPAADGPRLRRGRHRRGRPRGHRPRGHRRPDRGWWRRDPRPEAVAALRGPRRHPRGARRRARGATSSPKPAELSFEEAACLPTAWLTAYRMLFTKAGVQAGGHRARPGSRRWRGHRRDHPWPRGGAAGLGHQPRRGAPRAGRWSSARTRPSSRARGCPSGSTPSSRPWARRPGATASRRCALVDGWSSPGATSGPNPPADLARVFFLQLAVIGSTMGTRGELEALAALLRRDRHAPPGRLDVRPRGCARRPSSGWRAATPSASSSSPSDETPPNPLVIKHSWPHRNGAKAA